VAIAANLRRPDAPGELVDAVESQLGAVEVLVAAAGSGKRQSLEEVSIDDFDEMMAVNLRAPFRLAQRTVPGMRERGFGRVLFISSVAAFTGGVVGPEEVADLALAILRNPYMTNQVVGLDGGICPR
jgi:3-oxoacyl-[acyl-carrier protein] reductase